MPSLTIYIDDTAMERLNRLAARTGREPDELATASVEEALLQDAKDTGEIDSIERARLVPLPRIEPQPIVEPFASAGFTHEMVGGGNFLLAKYNERGDWLWISGMEGTGEPTETDWMICAYDRDCGGDFDVEWNSRDINDLKACLANALNWLATSR